MTQRSRPAGNGAACDQIDGRSVIDSTGSPAIFAEPDLEETLWRLIAGEIGLHELSPELAAWYSIAYEAGRASMVPALSRAESDRDRYYRLAFDTPAEREARMRASAEAHWAEVIGATDD